MIFSLDEEEGKLDNLPERTFSELGFFERQDLQEWIIDEPQILGENLLIVTAEFAGFRDTQDRLDLLAMDQSGELVVIEIKRDAADRTTDLQALKYASYCSTLTAEDVQQEFQEFHSSRHNKDLSSADVGKQFTKFLADYPDEVIVSGEGWAEFQLDNRPRILLAAGSFGTEITSPVMWLTEEFGMDITCVKLDVYSDDADVFISSQQAIPVPEAEDYMTKRRKKADSQADQEAWNGKDFYVSFGESKYRRWADAQRHGFISGGQGEWYNQFLDNLEIEKRVFVYIPGTGYVGYGTVESEKTPVTEFTVEHKGEERNILDVDLEASAMDENADSEENREYIVEIDWKETRTKDNAFNRSGNEIFSSQLTACRLKDQDTLNLLYDEFGIDERPMPD